MFKRILILPSFPNDILIDIIYYILSLFIRKDSNVFSLYYLFILAFKFDDNLEEKLNQDLTGLYYDQYAHIFQYEPHKLKFADQMLRNFFFNNEPISKENRWKFAKVRVDFLFICLFYNF